MYQIICTRTGLIWKHSLTKGKVLKNDGRGLESSKRYTATGMSVSERGHLCYLIPDLIDGEDTGEKLVERFIEIPEVLAESKKERAKKTSPKK